tara:strand:+ start:1908 stop:2198 length:291 start_codon:yes stop_codon:yes gene_type:complete
MKVSIFCTTCERASYLEFTNDNIINLNNFKTVKEVISELESLLGVAEYSESPFAHCYYKDCVGEPQNWVFWDEYRITSGEGLNWPITPELDVFYQT